MSAQKRTLQHILDKHQSNIKYVGIEQPYVAGSRFRGSGGEQSANMWAVYSMMLEVIREAQLPVVMFNITQFHSLIERRRGLTKTDIVNKCKQENPSFGRVDQHQADAYFIAKNAHAFWTFMDYLDAGVGFLSPSLTADQHDIFLSVKTGAKGNRTGIIWRAGDFWFDFRKSNPTTEPAGLTAYVDEGRHSISSKRDEGSL